MSPCPDLKLIHYISSKQKGRLKTETALPPLFRRPSTVFIGSTL
ncbi:hypothetical protein HMPREF9418_0714 [Neisseria macacae ATCC 33926]|uniref:Uncharacterized protein n=1 Tax=Neisseria macacae ATCC 33926 TaxID=997348 RepID=A0AA36XL92_9NEIS|nr:hypothetical protein HMPREF9418_0714 [Neisseria macacae ATCC 33926]